MRCSPLLALVCCALGACTGARQRSTRGDASGASVRLERAPGVTLVGLRVAVAYEIRYLNTRPGSHPLPSELARLEPGTRELVAVVEVKAGPEGEPVKLQRVWTVHVPRAVASSVTVVLGTSKAAPRLALKARGARVGRSRVPAPPTCASLNPDLASCEKAADPPARALCVIRAIRGHAKRKLNPGWMGCANHQGNRLRTARQLHGHAAAKGDTAARDELFARSAQLEAQARACVRQYFLCD